MTLTRALLVGLLALCVLPAVAAQGLRAVDVVKVGDASSEQEHDFAGAGLTGGVIDNRICRQTTDWLSYSMAVYEDTEVTLVCTFRGTEGRRLTFDLLVEGRKIVTHRFEAPSAAPRTIEFRIPFSITKGLTSIHVMLRAVDGLTPGLLELRTVQEHLERSAGEAPGPTGAAFW